MGDRVSGVQLWQDYQHQEDQVGTDRDGDSGADTD